MITDIAKQMERWGEHFSELYSRENVLLISALDAIEPLPTMEELDAIQTINNYKLEVVQQFTYLGSTISENMSLDAEINKPIGKAARTLGQLIIHVWENPKLTTPAKIVVYNVCKVSTLLKGSETWTAYAKQELEGQSAKCSGSCLCQPPHNVHAAQTT